jgi:hypothetical protein
MWFALSDLKGIPSFQGLSVIVFINLERMLLEEV